MYSEDELIALSALQHICFCDRQCALIHVEQVWLENRFTAEGRIMHDLVDSGKSESRRDLRIAYTVSLRSLRLGLVGKAEKLHALFNARVTPKAVFDKRCPSCSFFLFCLPKKLDGKKSASQYLDAIREGK